MSDSTLDPENIAGGTPRTRLKGHDVRSLGPSDSSDSGSDMAGPGLLNDDRLNLDRGTNEDTEAGHSGGVNAGAGVGDLEMDDNSDSVGTGEHLTAGKEPDIRVNGDIGIDRIVGADEAGLGGDPDDEAEEEQNGEGAR